MSLARQTRKQQHIGADTNNQYAARKLGLYGHGKLAPAYARQRTTRLSLQDFQE